jgi:hypothetical protein
MEHSAGRLFIKTTTLDPQELRFSLLFWDKLDFPSNNLIGMSGGPHAEFLASAGILQRTSITVRGSGSLEDTYRFAHIAAFRQLDAAQPGVWSIATGERSISFLDSELDVGRGALVGLHRTIPVPDKDVHLQDVLDFRAKRQAELAALRHYLDAIYEQVAGASDAPLAWNSKVEALDHAVSDYIKSTRGSGFRWRLASLEASVSIAGGPIAGLAAQSLGLSKAATALAVAVGSAFSLKAGAGLSRPKPTATPFRYVSAYHEELFPPG